MKTLRQAEAISKLAALVGEIIFVGVDVHKLTFHVALWSRERGLIATWVQPAGCEALLARLPGFERSCLRIVYEAGPTGFGLARFFRARGYVIDVAAPSHIPVLPGLQPKTDGLDCGKLAEFLGKGLLRKVYVLTEQEEADRQVVRHREQLMRKRKRCKHQIKSLLLQHGIAEPQGLKDWSIGAVNALRVLDVPPELRLCLDSLLDELDFMSRQVQKFSAQIAAMSQTERHREAFEQLCTIPGVGLITAMTFRTELPAPERFDRGEQVSRIIGLAPAVWQSGQTKRTGPLMKSGNARARAVLVEAAWRWIRLDEGPRKTFSRLAGNTGSSKKAIVGIARRLGLCMWRMSIDRKPYLSRAA